MINWLKTFFSTYETKRDRVLDFLSDGQWRSGAQLSLGMKMGSGFLYPTLAAMEHEGLIESTWGSGITLTDSDSKTRVRRRLYRALVTTAETP